MKHTLIQIAAIAMCCHEANRAYCQSQGDDTQPPWDAAEAWQKDSATAGVKMHLDNPEATPEQSHESWLAQKQADGWVFGEVKDAAAKVHPCMRPYGELPVEQKAKDYIFRATVHAVSAALTASGEPAGGTAVAPAVQRAQAGEDGLVLVTYIHSRPQWQDRIYGTGLTFQQGQTRRLPSDVAAKLLRHADCFEKAIPEPAFEQASAEPASAVLAPVVKDDTATQLEAAMKQQAAEREAQQAVLDMKDSVAQMGKDELEQFASTNFKQSLDKRRGVETLREQVNQLIDQFGVA